jgi:hypothetical protein
MAAKDGYFPAQMSNLCSHILLSIVHTFFNENYDVILPVRYSWKVPEKGFKINLVMH